MPTFFLQSVSLGHMKDRLLKWHLLQASTHETRCLRFADTLSVITDNTNKQDFLLNCAVFRVLD